MIICCILHELKPRIVKLIVMRKQWFLIFLFFSGISLVQAQSFVGGSVMQGTPISQFGNTKRLNKHGFAETGYYLGVDFNRFFHKNWGYAITIDGGNHSIDTKAMEDNLLLLGINDIKIGAYDYVITNIYGSFIYKTPSYKSFFISSNINLGLMLMNFPAFSYSSSPDNPNYDELVRFDEGGDGGSLELGSKISLNYQIHRFLIRGFYDYIYGKPRFTYYDAYSDDFKSFAQEVQMNRWGFQILYRLESDN